MLTMRLELIPETEQILSLSCLPFHQVSILFNILHSMWEVRFELTIFCSQNRCIRPLYYSHRHIYLRGRWDLNPRLLDRQTNTLPLSYSPTEVEAGLEPATYGL